MAVTCKSAATAWKEGADMFLPLSSSANYIVMYRDWRGISDSD
jgi:hypothetical protein